MRLVYHDNGSTESAVFAEAVKEVLHAAHGGEVRLVSPYLSCAVLQPIVVGRPFRILTDLPACFEVAADESLVAFLSENAQYVRHLQSVHAKAVITDGGLLVGSANLTHAGFAERDEMGCLFNEREVVQEALLWFEKLWNAAVSVNPTVIRSEAERGYLLKRTRLRNEADIPPLPASLSPHHSPATRTLGWMRSYRTPDGIGPAMDVARERTDLTAVLQSLTRSKAEARRVVELLNRALEVAGLEVDDERLHLNFGPGVGIAVDILQRYVAWCQRKRRVNEFGFILDDVVAAENAARNIPDAYSGRFRRQGRDDAPTLHVPVAKLKELRKDVLESWERAIRKEVRRGGKSSYLKHKRPFLFHAVRDAGMRDSILAEVHASEDNSERPATKLT